MAESQRIEELRRRVQKDPASIAFAQLAEELRRAEQLEESIDICRAGLSVHPGYLSARVTLGRALVELNRLDEALSELSHVLASAPENLAAIRGVAEIHYKRGELAEALSYYRTALALAKNDPDLQQTVEDLARKVDPPKPAAAAEGLSLEQITRELSIHQPPPMAPAPPVEAPTRVVRDSGAKLEWGQEPTVTTHRAEQAQPLQPQRHAAPTDVGAPPILSEGKPAPTDAGAEPARPAAERDGAHDRGERTVAALEKFLDAIHVARTDSRS